MDKKHCSGCRNNFYNGNNQYDIKECWHLKSARLILRKQVHIDQRPPWKQKAIMRPSCYSQPGYIFVGPNQEH